MPRLSAIIIGYIFLFMIPYGCRPQKDSKAAQANTAKRYDTDNAQSAQVFATVTLQPDVRTEPEQKNKPVSDPNLPKEPKTEKPPKEPEALPEQKTNQPDPKQSTPAIDKEKLPEDEPLVPDQPKKPLFYDLCDSLFSTYVNKEGLVDYELLRRKRADLLAATKEFDNVHPASYMSWTDEEKICLWINAYNIFTLKTVVDNYPIQPRWYMLNYPNNSIMHIPGVWTKNYFKVMGIEYTLQEIEQEILLKRFRDARICFTLSYATLGGAVLRNEAYLPDKLSTQLDDQTKKYVAGPSGMKVDQANGVIYLSNLFYTYKDTFIEGFGQVMRFRDKDPHTRSVFNFLVNHVPPETVTYFEDKDYTVRFLPYDWHLNELMKK